MEIMIWYSWVLGGLPILGLVLWWWNELWYVVLTRNDVVKLPPGHMGFPFFGDMFSFLFYFKLLRRPDDFINSKRRKYGDGVGLYRSYLFGSPTIIVWCPKACKYILQTEEFVMQWPNLDIVGSQSIVAVHGKSHTRIRSYVTNAINRPNSLARIAADVQPRLVSALQSWALSRHIKARPLIKKLTLESIGKLFASLEAGPLIDELDKLFEGVIKGVRSQPSKIPGTTCYRATQCRRKLEAIFTKEIEKRKQLIRNGERGENDLLDGLMQIKDENGSQLSDKEVLDNIISLIVGGYESTALSSTWAVYYLAKYPHILQKLREENKAMCDNKKGEFITAEDVSQLKYTNKVVEESIRMANVSQMLFRSANKDVDYKGYRIPKGWKVVLWSRYLHTDPDNYENPLCFNPDRWNSPAKPGTYQVFGGGIRICAGNMLARLQIALLLHHLSIGYKWELVNPDAKVSYLPNPAPVDGVEITFTKMIQPPI